jgi:hypothetical protein
MSQEKLEYTSEGSYRDSSTINPTETGKLFLGWCQKFRNRHPDQVSIPIKLQDQWWMRAATDSRNVQLLDAHNAG